MVVIIRPLGAIKYKHIYNRIKIIFRLPEFHHTPFLWYRRDYGDVLLQKQRTNNVRFFRERPRTIVTIVKQPAPRGCYRRIEAVHYFEFSDVVVANKASADVILTNVRGKKKNKNIYIVCFHGSQK